VYTRSYTMKSSAYATTVLPNVASSNPHLIRSDTQQYRTVWYAKRHVQSCAHAAVSSSYRAAGLLLSLVRICPRDRT
jgi:hypothetical protein